MRDERNFVLHLMSADSQSWSRSETAEFLQYISAKIIYYMSQVRSSTVVVV